jgi:mannonate dehydratase
MHQTWRWFGPHDLTALSDIAQAGAAGVVTALHHIPNGQVWSAEEIARRQNQVRFHPDGSPSGLDWDVVESLVPSEEIKTRRGDWKQHVANYKTSMANLAAAGVRTICYNFMPVIDWSRTDLAFRLPDGATCMRFDLADFAVFDIHILARPGAGDDFRPETRSEAARRFAAMDDQARAALTRNIVAGLPGANQNLTLDQLRAHIARYDAISPDLLRQHLTDFLSEVAPVAESLGVRLCCHPDDPPFPLLGLPRIMSTEADFARVMQAVDIPANGITLCSGSFGVDPDCDLPGLMRRWGHRVHFIHLRNVRREEAAYPGSFHEAAHLGGSTDMVELIAAILAEESRRGVQLPMRPDHGHDLNDDQRRGAQPGYPTVGRLKGLAELRGVITALAHGRTTFRA